MGKGIFKRKRTKLIALLAAACAFLAVGIGVGAAAASRAATARKEGTGASKIAYPKVRVIKPGDGAEAVLASDNPCNTTYTTANYYGSCKDWGTWSNFNSSAQIFNAVATPQIYGGWAGQSFLASVDLGAGISMPITAPIGFWNGTEFQNPNNLTPGETEASMMNGDYMGSIAVFPVDNGANYHSLLGGVSYDGTLNTAMESYLAGSNGQSLLDNIGLDSNGFGYTFNPESIQYMFQDDCNNSEILNNSYFAKMAALSTSELQTTLNDLIFGKEGIYTTDEAFYGSIPDSTVSGYFSDLKSEGDNLASQSTVEEYQKAFEAYAAAAEKYGVTDSTSPTSTSYQEARQAYLNALGKDASNDQPLLCLAVWDQNVGYQHFPKTESLYTQGSTTTGSPFNGGDVSSTYPYAYWGAGPSYQGSSNTADGTLEVEVTPVATDFLYSVMGGNSNSVTAGNAGIELMAMYQTNQTSASYSSQGAQVTVNIKPVSSGSGTLIANGAYLQINFNSLGQSPTSVNPTSLPSGVTLSTTSPASDGLYFKAVSQSGEPLKSVEMQLIPEGNGGGGGYYGDWKDGDTPIAPATNSAPSTVDGKQVWADSGNTYWAGFYNPISFSADSLSSQEGWFDFSGVGPGAYQVKILSGTTESGQSVSYGSYYTEPTFQIDASSYSSPEKISAVTDPCGFVDPAQDEVVVGAKNPSSAEVSGTSLSSSSFTATVGSSNPYTYQAEAYLPFSLSGQKNTSGTASSSTPLSFSLSVPGQSVASGSVKVNGLALSSLSGSSSSISGSSLTLSLTPQDISTIESKGEMPAGSSGSLTQNGETNRTLAVTWQAYLTPSFTSSSSSTFEFSYKAYSAANSNDKTAALTPEVETNGPASNSVPSSLTPGSTPSSSSGLWFKDLNADGSASSGAEFSVQNASGLYLNEDKDSSGAFTGWTWSSTPQDFSYNPSGNTDTGLFSFGGLQDGTYTVTLQQWPQSVADCSQEGGWTTDNFPNLYPDSMGQTFEYPWAGKAESGYAGSFQVALSYSSPESMSTAADPAGLVDSSQDALYTLAPTLTGAASTVSSSFADGYSKWVQATESGPYAALTGDINWFWVPDLLGSETIGVPFTGAWEGYLPMAVTSPTSGAGKLGLDTSMGVTLQGYRGAELSGISASNVKVAGIPLSSIPGASLASVQTAADDWNQEMDYGSLNTATGDAYTITLPYQALEYLQQNGKNAEGEPLSSSSNRLILITYPQVLTGNLSDLQNGRVATESWLTLGSRWWSELASPDDWVSQKNGVPGPTRGAPYSWNGPADNSVPSSLSPTDSSTSTGLWFKSLWWGTSNPATGAKFTVSQTQGGKTVYLTPEETSGKFSGWSWQDTPYDFSEQDSDADFSFGGLANGTYTVTEVDPAATATSSSLSFTATLSFDTDSADFEKGTFSSPEALTSVSDPLNLLSPKEGIVYNVVIPSHLPFTGGRWILILSAAAVLLFGAGAAFFLLRKRRA